MKKRKAIASKQKHKTRGGAQKSPQPIDDRALRTHLVRLLEGGSAHIGFDEAVAGWPEKLRGVQPVGAAHTPWQVLEHLRIAQWDILEFSRNEKHVSPEFPAGYWPGTPKPVRDGAWEESITAYRADHAAMVALVKNPATDLLAKIPWGDGQTILREALVAADHAAYHIGQLVLLRRLLGDWKDKS